MNKILALITFVLGGKNEITNKAVDEGLVSFEGQGRNKYGR